MRRSRSRAKAAAPSPPRGTSFPPCCLCACGAHFSDKLASRERKSATRSHAPAREQRRACDLVLQLRAHKGGTLAGLHVQVLCMPGLVVAPRPWARARAAALSRVPSTRYGAPSTSMKTPARKSLLEMDAANTCTDQPAARAQRHACAPPAACTWCNAARVPAGCRGAAAWARRCSARSGPPHRA